jgi:hypothetical protein
MIVDQDDAKPAGIVLVEQRAQRAADIGSLVARRDHRHDVGHVGHGWCLGIPVQPGPGMPEAMASEEQVGPACEGKHDEQERPAIEIHPSCGVVALHNNLSR